MGIHSFFTGVALGVCTTNEESWEMVIAIASHKWTEALTMGVSFVSSKIKVNKAIGYIVFYSFFTPLGILLGYFINSLGNEKLVGIFMSISVGTFLYISCGEIIVEEFSISKNKGWKFLFYCLGAAFIIILGLLIEH